MNKEFIPYEQALKFKELGFDEPCFGAYGAWGFMSSNDVNSLSDEVTQEDLDNQGYNEEDGVCLAPLYQQVVEWLRQKGIIIELIVDGWGDDNCVNEENLCYRIFIWQIGKPKPHHNDDLGALATPQEAYSVAFDYILNIKNRFFDI